LALLLYLLAALAWAEKADRDKPVHIESDKLTADDLKKVSVFTGNVVLTQGTIRLTADTMTVRQDDKDFRYASAFGNPVTFRQKREGLNEWVDGVAQHAEYDGRQGKVELFDRVVVHRDHDQIAGNYLNYDMNTETLKAQDQATPVKGKEPASRVHVVIQPKNEADGSGKPTPAKPLTPALPLKTE
jgi:lipopolysaccharide export system protein LptA